jgi:hypothetical protein
MSPLLTTVTAMVVSTELTQGPKLLAGIGRDSPDGKVIQWGHAVAAIYDKNPKTRISYPDFVWDDDSLCLTETQKDIGTVHHLPDKPARHAWGGPAVKLTHVPATRRPFSAGNEPAVLDRRKREG